jgi:crotonobetainyl-CoA:carnitine CoA-transferase CaiB-like acyl-CoA transferase
VRVLDFGRYIAGPYCATLLAEFGADVIRVEKRGGSEDRFVAPVGAGGEGALFLQINRNKKCITLDPMKAEGRRCYGDWSRGRTWWSRTCRRRRCKR